MNRISSRLNKVGRFNRIADEEVDRDKERALSAFKIIQEWLRALTTGLWADSTIFSALQALKDLGLNSVYDDLMSARNAHKETVGLLRYVLMTLDKFYDLKDDVD